VNVEEAKMKNATVNGQDLKLYELYLTTTAGHEFALSPDAYKIAAEHDADEDIAACVAQRTGKRGDEKRIAAWFLANCLKRHKVKPDDVADAADWQEYALEIAGAAVKVDLKKADLKKEAKAKATKSKATKGKTTKKGAK
jgi:hypothetical protein